jgi:hypothetical protein
MKILSHVAEVYLARGNAEVVAKEIRHSYLLHDVQRGDNQEHWTKITDLNNETARLRERFESFQWRNTFAIWAIAVGCVIWMARTK